LQISDAVVSADGDFGTVDALVITDGTAEVYNLTVDEAHTYFVGDGAWLVHNSCEPDGDDGNSGKPPDIVYRNPSIRTNEHPGALEAGFYAKDPSKNYHPQYHISHGNTKNTQYISVMEVTFG